MASASVEGILRAIAEKGFWKLDDPAIGSRVDGIVNSGFHIKTVDGLELCEASTFSNQYVRDVIDASFGESVLGFYKVYGQTKLDHCIQNKSAKKNAISILVVHTCSSGSELMIHESSHLYYLNATDAPNGLLAIPKDRLEQPGIIHTLVQLEHGGIILSDSRLGWRVLKGMTVLLGEMDSHEAMHWVAMPWPSLPALLAKVAEMDSKSKSFSRNFKWESTVQETNPQLSSAKQ